MRQTVLLTSPQQLLSLVPVLFGYHPQASVVVLGTEPPPTGKIMVGLRYPCYDPADPDTAALSVWHAVTLLTREHYLTAAAIGYGPDELVAPFIDLLRHQAGEHGIELYELLRAEDRRYWSYACTDPACSPPEGKPYDETPDPALAALLPDGVPEVLASRKSLAALLAPCRGTEAAAMRNVTRKAEERAARLTERARQSADPATRRYPIASAGIRALRAAIQAYREDQPVTRDQAGWLLVALHDIWVRDDALCRMDPAHRRAHLRLLTDLTRLARPGHVAAPATLLALVAWQAGNGALANVALDRAIDDAPRYPLAGVLRDLISCGTPPAKAQPPMTPRQLAAGYRAAASRAAASDADGPARTPSR
jgi:Domain of unknown function (DUF4192)